MKWKRLVSGVCGLVMAVVTLPVLADNSVELAAVDASSTISDGLMAYLNMDDNIEDQTGIGSPDKVGSFTYVDGLKGGKAIRFDGASGKTNSNRLEFKREDLKFGSGAKFSISYWMKATASPSDGYIVGSKDWSAARNYGYCLATSESKMQFIAKAGDTNTFRKIYQYPGNGLSDSFGAWMHVVVTRNSDGDIDTIYINGEKVAIDATTNVPFDDGRLGWGNMCIGADYSGHYGIGNTMALDEFRVWNRVINEDEVRYLYQDGAGAITSLALSAPENLAVGTEGVSIDVTALASTNEFQNFVPGKKLTWTVSDSQNASIEETSYGTARLSVKPSIQDGAKLTVTVSDGSVSDSREITVTKNIVPTKIEILGAEDITKSNDVDVTETYTCKLTDENGAIAEVQDAEEIKWTLSYAHGVVFEGQDASLNTKTGKSVTIAVPKDIVPGKAFTLTASYKTYTSSKKGYIFPDRKALPSTLEAKVKNRWDFEENTDAAKGDLAVQTSGSFTYADGIDGKSIVFQNESGKEGKYISFGPVDLRNKSISFAIKPNSRPAKNDPAILANKDWNTDSNAKGFVFAYSYDSAGGYASNYKNRLGGSPDKNQTAGRDTIFAYPNGTWHTITLSFDNAGKKYTIYKNDQIVKEIDLTEFQENCQNGSYPLILGNDGTGKYPSNKSENYNFQIDNFMLIDGAVSKEEVKAISEMNMIVVKDYGRKEITSDLVGTASAVTGSGYNLNVHVSGEETGFVAKTTFDVTYDKELLEYNSSVTQYQRSGLKVDSSEAGVLHVTYDGTLQSGTTKEYSKTRIFQPAFKVKSTDTDQTAVFTVGNFKGYNVDDEPLTILSHDTRMELNVLANVANDYNGDGVIGAGDIALAPAEQKAAVAAEAEIRPYKRALVLTMDGGGNVWDPDKAHYLAEEFTGKNSGGGEKGENYSKYPEKMKEVRKNPYVMDLYNKEFATSYTAKAENPPISAQNYCSINHGQMYTKFPAAYKRDNDQAGAVYWEDFGKAAPEYPSMFQVIKSQTPRRGLYASTEWSPIMNGIIEPDSGMYQIYPGGATIDYNDLTQVTSPVFQKTVDYINSGQAKNTALIYLQTDLMDHYGHAKGYFTDGYYKVLESMDGFYQDLFDSLKAQDLYEDTLFVGNADHGGHFNTTWNWPSGSHGTYSYPQDTTIFIGLGGQTIDSGRTLSGGENHDIPALVLNALRLEKPSSMSNSDVFDPSAFLSQEALSKKNREIEKVTYTRTADRAVISVGNEQAGRTVSTLDAVIDAGTIISADHIQVNPVAGVTVLRKTLENGKLKLSLSGEKLSGTAAALSFTGQEAQNTRIDEVMLGVSNTGKEIYADLENINSDSTNSIQECMVKGLQATVSLEMLQPQDAVLVVAQYNGGYTVGMKMLDVTAAEFGTLNKEVALDDVAFDTVRVFLWDGIHTMQPLCEGINGNIITE